MGIKEFFQRMQERRNKEKEIEEDMRTRERIEEKKMSSNERELRRFIKEKREKEIKEQLEIMRLNRKNEDFELNRSLTKPQNIFADGDDKMLGQGNMFKNNPNLFFK